MFETPPPFIFTCEPTRFRPAPLTALCVVLAWAWGVGTRPLRCKDAAYDVIIVDQISTAIPLLKFFHPAKVRHTRRI